LFGVHVSLAKKLGNESLNVARNYEDPPAPFSPNWKVILLICTFSEHKLAIERFATLQWSSTADNCSILSLC